MSDVLAVGRSVKICCLSVEMQRLAAEQLLRENSSWQIGLVHGPREGITKQEDGPGWDSLKAAH